MKDLDVAKKYAHALFADVGLHRIDRLGDERLAFFLSDRRHQAARAFIRKSLGATPKWRLNARLKLALF